MTSKHWLLTTGLALLIGAVWVVEVRAQTGTALDNGDPFHNAEQSLVLILTGSGDGRVQSVTMGVVIRSDGVVLTAYHPLKTAQEVQVRLRDGEIYDQVSLIGFDERRDVAALRFSANGLSFLSCATPAGTAMGEKVRALGTDGAMAWSSSEGTFGPARLADVIVGAGHGYRVIQFISPVSQTVPGGALVNSRGQLMGIITASLNYAGTQFAVPVESVAGLPSQGLQTRFGSGKNLALPLLVSSRDVAAEEPPTPSMALAKARTLRVISRTIYFTPFMLEQELLSNTSFRELEISVLEGHQGGELLFTVDRPALTYDFTYALTDGNSGAVISAGKITAIDGPHAAQMLAKKLAEELAKARSEQPAQANRQEAPRPQP